MLTDHNICKCEIWILNYILTEIHPLANGNLIHELRTVSGKQWAWYKFILLDFFDKPQPIK